MSSSVQREGKCSNRLYIGNLHPSTSEGDLINIFKDFGKITKVDYMWHKSGPNRGQPKGFAFLEYDSEADAAKAVKQSGKVLTRGRKLVVRYSDSEFASTTTTSRIGAYSLATDSRDPSNKREREDENTDSDSKKFKQIKNIEEQMKKLQRALNQANPPPKPNPTPKPNPDPTPKPNLDTKSKPDPNCDPNP